MDEATPLVGSPPKPPTPPQKKSLKETNKSSRTMFLILASVLISTANSLTYKKLLTRFNAVDGSANLEFFVSQWTTLLYLLPSFLVVLVSHRKKSPKARRQGVEQMKTHQLQYFMMGFFDAASSTLGAIAGALTPGQLQTLIGQTSIPMVSLKRGGGEDEVNEPWQKRGRLDVVSRTRPPPPKPNSPSPQT